MVDYLVCATEDPFGVQIDGGEVVKILPGGEVEWSTICRRQFEGSGSAKINVRNVERDARENSLASLRYRPTFEIGHASPAKFLQGHNLFGSANVERLLRDCLDRVGDALGVHRRDYLSLGMTEISRIDLAAHWLLDRESDVLPFLKAIQERCVMPYRGRGVFGAGDPGTLYYGYKNKGERAGDWALKLYAKGRELAKRPLPAEALAVPGLLDEINRTIRVEVTLRTAELKRLGLRRVRDWTEEKALAIWEQYVGRLNMQQLELDLATSEEVNLNARHRALLIAWQNGTDMRDVLPSRSAFYRARKVIRDATGIDVAGDVPKSNVVPLRRVVEAKPALHPHWADALTAALSRHAA